MADRKPMTIFLSVLVWVNFFSIPPSHADCVFVNTNSDANSVAAFKVNSDGSLTAVPGSPFATGGSGGFTADVGSITIKISNNILYTTNSESANVSGFTIDPSACTLTLIKGSPWAAGSEPTGVASNPAGSYLFVSNFSDNTISVYAIQADGSLSEIGLSPFSVPETPFDLQVSHDGSTLFVSHDFIDSVGVYAIAPDGSISAVAGSPFAANGGEQGLTLNPPSSRLYVADFSNGTISGFSVGAGGALAPLAGSPYPAGLLSVIEVLTDPADRFLFASNNSDDTIGVYAIASDGSLSEIGGSPFTASGSGPAGLAVNPAGSFLYVANGGFDGSTDVGVYQIASDGSLTPISGSPFATGGDGVADGIVYFTPPGAPTPVPAMDVWGMVAFISVSVLISIRLLKKRAFEA